MSVTFIFNEYEQILTRTQGDNVEEFHCINWDAGTNAEADEFIFADSNEVRRYAFKGCNDKNGKFIFTEFSSYSSGWMSEALLQITNRIYG